MKKKKISPSPVLDPLAFMNHPHDKYARFVLQNLEVALELLRFILPPEILAVIDLNALQLSEDSFLDPKLREQFSDICYSGKTLGGEPIDIVIIFEHKSKLDRWALEQLLHYISGYWSSNRKQEQPLAPPIPILVYHDQPPIDLETPATLFPKAPSALLPFVPSFKYILLDVCRLPDDLLENLPFLRLRNILLAMKYSRDEKYLRENWKKIIIFAPEFRNTGEHREIFQATVIYMSRVSTVFNENITEMEKALSQAEYSDVKPYIIQLYENWLNQGLEKGMQKGLEKGFIKALSTFIKQNPDWSDRQIAKSFDVQEDLVKEVRASVHVRRKKDS
jgi:predicted transposase/invertase (TIGR01784 family)